MAVVASGTVVEGGAVVVVAGSQLNVKRLVRDKAARVDVTPRVRRRKLTLRNSPDFNLAPVCEIQTVPELAVLAT